MDLKMKKNGELYSVFENKKIERMCCHDKSRTCSVSCVHFDLDVEDEPFRGGIKRPQTGKVTLLCADSGVANCNVFAVELDSDHTPF